MPVTFHKKISSSGYGSAPTSNKYSRKEKQIKAQKLAEPSFYVTRDFYTKPLPMEISKDTSVLNDT